jgi:glycosyltransferase involved in cell wall biosynthesis
VAVVTPTWGPQRHVVLIERCIASVRAQTFTDWEHVIVSDGPDPALRSLGDIPGVRYFELPNHVEPHSWGANCRNHGARHTKAEYIAYLDSDNAFHPDHLELLVAALDAAGADFAYSRMRIVGGQEIGADPPELGQIDTSLILHRRRGLKAFGIWPVEPYYAIDWKFIEGWIDKGARWAFVPTVTVDYHRS